MPGKKIIINKDKNKTLYYIMVEANNRLVDGIIIHNNNR